MTTASQIQTKLDANDHQFCLTVCEKFEFCAVNLGVPSSIFRIMIYQLRDASGDVLNYMTELDLSNQWFDYLENNCFSHYVGDNIILCAHTYSHNRTALAFGYDVKANQLSLISSVLIGKGKYCYNLCRIGNQVCGIVRGGYILRFKFNFSVQI